MKETAVPVEEGDLENATGTVFIRVAVPELKVQKCLQFQLEDTVWQAKQRVLVAFAKQELRDAINYGLYLPPANGRAGKFLEEQRMLREYPIQGPIGFLEFKYKRRVYKMMQLNERKLKQLHAKSKLKLFLELVRAGSSDKLAKMTIKGLDPNFHDQDNGETPLSISVTLGKSKCREVIITLVSGGAHLDFRNRQGLTALHRAAIVGNGEAIRALLDLGAAPDSKDARDLSPLYYSVSNDDSAQDCTHMLLHERARIGICDEHGWYEIHQACKYGRVQHLEHLLFYGAEMDVRNSCGNTPLHVCALNNQEACARVLLFRGAEPGVLNYNNQTADQVAGVSGNNSIADMISKHNPDDVVPFREIPQYSDRRKTASLTPSLRALIRCRSDPRINLAGLDSPISRSSPSGRHRPGDSDSACSFSVSSSGSVTGSGEHGVYEGRTASGKEGIFPGNHVAQLKSRRAGSLGDVHNLAREATQRNTLATLVHADRDQVPRVVLLHRSSEGYGFVLRGAKSKIPTGGSFNDFTPTAEYPALQYLDSVDSGSQADRAGLKGGDFILEINGENVIRASHEHVVHLIRSSSDVLTLKVVTVTLAVSTDWTGHQDSGAMTLPSRKKLAAPLPPQRDPRTSLSYSKGNSKSMAEGLAEIEKLDATLAEFEGQEMTRCHSLHGLNTLDDPKVASVRASHAVKRVSVLDYEGLISGEPPEGSKDGGPRKEHMGPAEARVKKYHKKSPVMAMERSRSTPDITGDGDIQTGMAPQVARYTGALKSNGQYQSSAPGTPELPDRVPVNSPTPEVVRIHTGSKNSSIYANVSADIQTRKKNESSYESSFRPGDNAKVVPDQTILKKTARGSPKDDRTNVSFADNRVMENAQKFLQKHPNATLLVTADIHTGKGKKKEDKKMDVYEPEPDYDDSDEDMKRSAVTSAGTKPKPAVTVISITSDKPTTTRQIGKHEESNRSSPSQSLANSRRSSGVAIHPGTPPSSGDNSRRSSGQSDVTGPKLGLRVVTAMTPAVQAKEPEPSETPIPPPPPPPPPNAPPPPPPAITSGEMSLRRKETSQVLAEHVSTEDIMMAVAERNARMQTEGPKIKEVTKSIAARKSVFEMNQEALREAVAKRKSRLDQGEDRSAHIEAQLSKSKKLQAVKHFGGEVRTYNNKGAAPTNKGQNDNTKSGSVSPPTAAKPKDSSQTSKDVAPVSSGSSPLMSFELKRASARPNPAASAKPEPTQIDFKARLRPVEQRVSKSNSSTPPSSSPVLAINKTKAPPPPPAAKESKPAPLAVSAVTSTSSTTSVNKSEPNKNQTPTSPSNNSANYIALAEKARQEYLKKKASGNLVSNVQKKGPVEITPMKKNSPRSPTSPTVKPLSKPGKAATNGGLAVTGVTEDHSHTEPSLSNGTIKKVNKPSSPSSPPPHLIPPPPPPHNGFDSGPDLPPPPPPGFGDEAATRGVIIDIIPPPSSFGTADSPQVPAFGQEDTASFVSSVSSLSTLSSEHGETNHPDKVIEDLIAPPPPPIFDEANLGDQEAFIPPPPEFLEIDANSNVSKALDKNSRPFVRKPVMNWSCMDVLDWLDSLGLPQYRVSFAKACVDGSKLVAMGRNEFINLGVTQVGHRMNLERSVKKLSMAVSTNL